MAILVGASLWPGVLIPVVGSIRCIMMIMIVVGVPLSREHLYDRAFDAAMQFLTAHERMALHEHMSSRRE